MTTDDAGQSLGEPDPVVAQAFDLLRIASQHGHRKLADIATEVADTGTLNLPEIGAERRTPRGSGTKNGRSPLPGGGDV